MAPEKKTLFFQAVGPKIREDFRAQKRRDSSSGFTGINLQSKAEVSAPLIQSAAIACRLSALTSGNLAEARFPQKAKRAPGDVPSARRGAGASATKGHQPPPSVVMK